MTELRRFGGAAAAAVVLVLVAALWWVTAVEPEPASEPDALFRFDKEQLSGIRIVRPSDTIELVREGDHWVSTTHDWRPSATMVRRVGHQLHDLTARARVADSSGDLEAYGLGDDAIEVHLTLDDGTRYSVAVGDPNPTSVSWYVRLLPDGPVYVVKKAAVDYFRFDAEDFREDRIAFFDAADCTSIEMVVGGQRRVVERTGDTTWRLAIPMELEADRDAVSRVIGAVASARALRTVADHPADRTQWGLADSRDRVRVVLASDEPIELHFGDSAGGDPEQRYVWHVGDDAVYAVRASVFDPIGIEVDALRNTRLVGRRVTELEWIHVVQGDREVRIERSADSWRWPDGGEVSGATPRRVADAAVGLRARGFRDDTAASALEEWAVATLGFAEDEVRIALAGPDGTLAAVSGQVAEVDGTLAERIEDLLREHGRRLDREAERR